MYTQNVTINNEVGLHARPATFFIQKANEFKSGIWLEKDERRVNAKSLLGVLSLGIVKGTTITLLADGADFAWKCHEHCLLLVGYDDEHYWFNDPWHNHGVCAQPKALVEDCHAAQGMFAVTLKRK